MIVLSLLPLLLTAQLMLVTIGRVGHADGLRLRLLSAALWVALGSLLCAELLGLMGVLHTGPVRALGLVTVVGLGLGQRHAITAGWQLVMGHLSRRWQGLDRSERAVAVALLGLVALQLSLAIVGSVSNYDSQTYHLARVRHWLQQGGLAHYATPEVRQLSLSPGAEVLQLLVLALGGSDVLVPAANAIVWVLCGVAVSALAEALGARARWALIGTVVTLGSGVIWLQGSSTQNDLWAGLWLCVAAVHGVQPLSRRTLLTSAAALGLALATKGTILVWGLPVGLVLGVSALQAAAARRLPVWALAVAALLLLAPLIGPIGRNMLAFGSPTGPDFGLPVLRPSAMGAAGTALRYTAGHFQFDWVAGALTAGVDWTLGALGHSAQDPATTWGPAFAVGNFSANEDYAGAPWLVLASILCGVTVRVWWRDLRLRVGLLMLMLALGLFCALLKWQVWGLRLQVPLLLLAGAWAAAVVSQWPTRARRWASVALVGLTALTLLRTTVENPLKPPFTRGERLSVWSASADANRFRIRPQLLEPYRALADSVAQWAAQHAPDRPVHLGMRVSFDSWEYPLWVLLDARLPQGYRLEHLTVAPKLRAPKPTDASAVDLVLTVDNAVGHCALEVVNR